MSLLVFLQQESDDCLLTIGIKDYWEKCEFLQGSDQDDQFY